MMIVFGIKSFRIRSFSLEDLGILYNEEPDVRIEVRQTYFHLFYIPCFGLGKMWAVRKNDRLYEMTLALQLLVDESAAAKAVKTPFYTYAGPLLAILSAVIGFLGYQLNENYSHYKDKQTNIRHFNAEKAVLESKLQHLTTRDFISVLRLSNSWKDTTIYLKIEDIKGDEITVTPVEMITPTQRDRPMAWEVEDEYYRYASYLSPVKISCKQLQAGCLKEYIASSDRETLRQQGINLLHDGRRYVTTAVVRHFGPVISSSGTGGLLGASKELSIGMNNEGWPATISDIKELAGNGDWSENLNKKVPGKELGLFVPGFALEAAHMTFKKPYKLIMTLKDTTGQLHKYEVSGVDLHYAVKDL